MLIFFLYLIAWCQGITWTIIPAIANVLTGSSCFTITESQYGSLYPPLILSAILASNFGGIFSYFQGSKRLLIIGLLFNFIALLLFSIGSFYFLDNKNGFIFIFLGQLILGCGIGCVLTSINVLALKFISKNTAFSIVSLYACISFGGSISPLIFGTSSHKCNWGILTLAIAIIFLILLVSIKIFIPKHYLHLPKAIEVKEKLFKGISQRILTFAIIAIIYGMSEAGFSNWMTIFLHVEKHISIEDVSFGLSCFWGAVSLGQISIALATNYFSSKAIYKLLPFVIILAFCNFLFVATKIQSIIFFIIAGLGCSAFFPLTVNFAEQKALKKPEFISGIVVTGYFIGTAISSFFIGFLTEYFHVKLTNTFISIAILVIIMEILCIFTMKHTGEKTNKL